MLGSWLTRVLNGDSQNTNAAWEVAVANRGNHASNDNVNIYAMCAYIN